MAKYRLYLTTDAFSDMEFETDLTDKDEIIDAFFESLPNFPAVCAQCSGWNKWDPPLELGDEWDVTDMEHID